MVLGPHARYKGVVTNDTNQPSLSPPSPDELPDPTRPVPGRDPRPRSALAVWALILSILLMLVGMFTGLFWLALVPPFILSAIAVARIKPQVSRGQGMAIAALLMSFLAGGCQFWMGSQARGFFEDTAAGVLAAAGAEDPKKVDEWLTEAKAKGGHGETIRERFRKVVEIMGPYQRKVSSRMPLLGMIPLGLPPSHVREIGGADEADESEADESEADENEAVEEEAGAAEGGEEPRLGGLWVTAEFEKGTVHVEMVISQQAPPLDPEQVQGGRASRMLEDLRFFVDAGGE